jgi:hypothetical protein
LVAGSSPAGPTRLMQLGAIASANVTTLGLRRGYTRYVPFDFSTLACDAPEIKFWSEAGSLSPPTPQRSAGIGCDPAVKRGRQSPPANVALGSAFYPANIASASLGRRLVRLGIGKTR